MSQQGSFIREQRHSIGLIFKLLNHKIHLLSPWFANVSPSPETLLLEKKMEKEEKEGEEREKRRAGGEEHPQNVDSTTSCAEGARQTRTQTRRPQSLCSTRARPAQQSIQQALSFPAQKQ